MSKADKATQTIRRRAEGGNISPLPLGISGTSDVLNRMKSRGLITGDEDNVKNYAASQVKRAGMDPMKVLGVDAKYAAGGAPSFNPRLYRFDIGDPIGGGEPGVGGGASHGIHVGKASMPKMPNVNVKPASLPHIGMIHSAVPGRTDKIPLGVKGGSYILPADVVSGIGQGNSMAGSAVLNKMFKMGPYGSPSKMDATPKPNFGHPMNVPGSGLKMPHFAPGGTPPAGGKPVPIIAAGGEFAVPPEVVLKIGHGDMKEGHRILDEMVLHLRRKTIHQLKHLKPPKKR